MRQQATTLRHHSANEADALAQTVFSHRPAYRPAPSSRWVGLGGTLSIYAMALAVLLVSISSSVIKPAPSATLTVIAVHSPASPPDTPPQPRPATRPTPPKPAIQRPAQATPAPPVKLPIPVLTVPAAVPKPVEPAPKPSEASAPKTAPAPPAPAQADAGPESWQGRVLMRLSSKRHYPASAMARHQQGVPYIRFTMDRRGKVLAVSLERSSGVPDLDQEALALPRRAQPLPRPPEDVPGDTLEIVVPIEFFMR
ncbi:MAG TPA: TonB family protein [Novosphingobium sp.]|nr:TonB family protein [Novosphingobium sp.]